jgi:MinD-like ATPase involved in chromosome partitioning or flagellar assembly
MGEVISFYSYKGGVGRSMLLANVAVVLAQRGRRVLCIDFDLEAGGLHTIFGLPADRIKSTTLDLLLANGAAAEAIDVSSLSNLAGRLWLLPTISEIAKVNAVFNSLRDLPMRLDGIIAELEDQYAPEFVFVDSRAGFAEFAAPPLALAKRIVCVMRPNRQNTDGLRTLLDVMDTLNRTPPHIIVLSQVPDLPHAIGRISELENLMGSGRRFSVHIPFAPELALDERIAALEMPESRLTASYSLVADWVERPA